jgi:rfaE bifunctional protein nucleotidyltransferase chain/domain
MPEKRVGAEIYCQTGCQSSDSIKVHQVRWMTTMSTAAVDGKGGVVVVAASGGFDPLHVGHVEYLEQAKKLGDRLVVIVNSDAFLVRKKGYAFMPMEERMKIVKALKSVDEVVPCIDQDQSVCATLAQLKPTIFAKGGDRFNSEIPEAQICKKLGIQVVDGLGQKLQSSSTLVNKHRKHQPTKLSPTPNPTSVPSNSAQPFKH